MERPAFSSLTTYEEFQHYYWYHKELEAICLSLGLSHQGTKQDLNNVLKAYFKGETIESKKPKSISKRERGKLSLTTPLLTCGFVFNQKFRDYFGQLTGDIPFKFTADMATAWRKVKAEEDTSFTIQDMLDLYKGQSDYAKYDNGACQWNQFVKDFCADQQSQHFNQKIKVAALLWKKVKQTKEAKVYSTNLLVRYEDLISIYKK